VRRDKIIRNNPEIGEVVIKRWMIAAESDPDPDACFLSKLFKAPIEWVICRPADEGNL
jgi:hypothetical protein